MRKIKLNETYITTFGKEFIPVEKVSSIRKPYNYAGNSNCVFQNEESRFLDKNGNKIRKSKLSHIKGKPIPKKPKSTI